MHTEWKRSQYYTLCAAIFLIFGYGIFNYMPGYFMSSVVESLGSSRMAFTIHTAIASVTAVLTAPFFGKMIKDVDSIRRVIFVGAIVGSISYLLISRITQIWQLYVLSLLLGFVANNCTMVCAVALIEKAFPNNSGTPTGIAMSGTGICSAIVSLFMPAVIEQQGWEIGYLLVAVLWGAMLILSCLVTIGIENAQSAIAENTKAHISLPGVSYRDAMHTPVMAVFTVIVLVICINMVFLQHMPSFFTELGNDSIEAGRFMSLFSVSIVIAKIAVGTFYDKFGAAKTTVFCCITFAVGMWMQLWWGQHRILLSIGIVIVTFGHTMCNVLLPLLTKQLFGAREYASIWSYISGCIMLGYAVGAPIWGRVYDMLGSYRIAVLISPLTIILCGIGILLLLKDYTFTAMKKRTHQ